MLGFQHLFSVLRSICDVFAHAAFPFKSNVGVLTWAYNPMRSPLIKQMSVGKSIYRSISLFDKITRSNSKLSRFSEMSIGYRPSPIGVT